MQSNQTPKIIPEHERTLHYVDGEQHKYLGYFYPLVVLKSFNGNSVELKDKKMILRVEHPESLSEKEMTLDLWYRKQAETLFLDKLSSMLVLARNYTNIKPHLRIYRMPSRWGSCSPKSHVLILNLDLIKAPVPCIEYIVLHEVLHLKYPSHDLGFYAALSHLMPNWHTRESILNRFFPL